MRSKLSPFLGILALLQFTACAPTATILSAETRTVVGSRSIPKAGTIRTKPAGQPLLTYVKSKTTFQRVAVMVSGFSQPASFASNGYSIEIPVGAKGLLTGLSGACFHNHGLNAGVFRSQGTTNFCFEDTNRDDLFEKARLDTINNWGNLDIAPVRYRVEEVPVGYGVIEKKREIVFVGMGSGKPILEYREFVGNETTTPTRKVELILEEASGTVGTVTIEGAKLKIHAADETRVRYEVMSGFAEN